MELALDAAPDETQNADRLPEGDAIFRDGRGVAAALGLFAAALVLRLVYLGQIGDHPFLLHPVNDAKAYDDWAARIAGGEWWGSEAFYQAPAYPYLLAIIYRVGGHDLGLAHTVQMVMGAPRLRVLEKLEMGTQESRV